MVAACLLLLPVPVPVPVGVRCTPPYVCNAARLGLWPVLVALLGVGACVCMCMWDPLGDCIFDITGVAATGVLAVAMPCVPCMLRPTLALPVVPATFLLLLLRIVGTGVVGMYAGSSKRLISRGLLLLLVLLPLVAVVAVLLPLENGSAEAGAEAGCKWEQASAEVGVVEPLMYARTGD